MRTANVWAYHCGIGNVRHRRVWQMDSARSGNGQKAEAVEDAAGNLHVPEAYRTRLISRWEAGRLVLIRRRARGTPSRLCVAGELSPPTVGRPFS